jgi:hypothetical protein
MQLDFGGMLAGSFAVVSIWFFMQAANSKRPSYLLFLSCIAIVISTAFKPNFPVLVLLIQLIFAIKNKYIKQIITFIINSSCILGIYLFDKFNESPFLAVDEKSPYFVAFRPIQNLELVSYYIARALNPFLMFLIIILTLNLIRLRKYRIVLFFATMIPTTSIPISLLINRPWEMYSWYSLIPIGLYLVFALDITVKNIRNRKLSITKFPVSIYILFTVSILFSQYQGNVSERGWFHYVQDYNQMLNISLVSIDNSSSQKILLSGLTGPYHQLKNTEFSQRVYPNLGNFDVLLRRAEEPWNEMSTRQSNGIYFENAKFSDYSKIYIFTTKGTLAGIVEAGELIGIPTNHVKSILYCSTEKFDLKFGVGIHSSENDPVCLKSY